MKNTASVDARALILGRVKESLTRLPTPPASPSIPRAGLDALPPASADADGAIRSLAMRLEELGASFVLCDEPAQVRDGLTGLFERSRWRRVVAVRSPGLETLLGALESRIVWVDAPASLPTRGDMDVVIVEADAVDAQFGAVFCGDGAGGLSAVALAPHLIAVAPESKLYGEFAGALAGVLARPGAASAGVTCLTGASVNRNIERKPIARGHGPQGLTVMIYRHGFE